MPRLASTPHPVSRLFARAQTTPFAVPTPPPPVAAFPLDSPSSCNKFCSSPLYPTHALASVKIQHFRLRPIASPRILWLPAPPSIYTLLTGNIRIHAGGEICPSSSSLSRSNRLPATSLFPYSSD